MEICFVYAYAYAYMHVSYMHMHIRNKFPQKISLDGVLKTQSRDERFSHPFDTDVISQILLGLVVRGNHQTDSTDYAELYAPVACIELIRLMFAVSAKKWSIESSWMSRARSCKQTYQKPKKCGLDFRLFQVWIMRTGGSFGWLSPSMVCVRHLSYGTNI